MIKLFSTNANRTESIQVTKDISSGKYFVLDANDKKTIGYLEKIDNSFFFNNLDMERIVAFSEDNSFDNQENIENVMSFATLNPRMNSYQKTGRYLIKGKEEQQLGVYYIALKNIELSINTEIEIVIVMTIFLDNQLNEHV